MINSVKLEIEDKEIYDLINLEKNRQNTKIELIASENFVSKPVLEAMGSVLTNKYAEGYPSKRYYGGCEYIDQIEQLAIDRAKELFNAEHVNVQPHSGSQANMGVYMAMLEVGDKILGMNLAHGGHLTHGSQVNFSGKLYNIIPYNVDDKTGEIDYDEVRRLAIENKPKLILAGASAYSRIINFSIFREIADEVGAYLMVDMAHIAGLVAAGLHPNPVLYADFVTTTTHKTLRGPRGGMILCKEKYAKQIDKSIFPGIQGGPLEHIIAGKAVCFGEALKPEFKQYQQQIILNAKALEEAFKEEGFNIVSNGTDNHLMLLDLRNKHVTGKQAQELLDGLNITANKNAIPNDPEGPTITSGLRVGTPAVTTRGFKESQMKIIAKLINLGLTDYENSKQYILDEVEKLCKEFPLYE